MNLKLGIELVKNMGFRYVNYRIFHELDKKVGTLQKRHPMHPIKKQYISLEEWKKLKIPFVFQDRNSIATIKNPTEILKEKATKILSGQVCFFSHEWKNLGLDYDWITNPDTNFKYNSSIHWSKINDFNPQNGDIKYVWEKSRFSYLQTIMRYDYHFETDNSEFVFSEIQSWIKANPINQGPNWKCSQETSLRLFNWLHALFFYKNSKHLTEGVFQEMMHVMYWKLHHVFHHINFSRIAVRNNHAITETLALTLSNLLFPFIPETKKWASIGKKYFEEEMRYQIYEDGAFIQHSMNYHRVLIQLLTFAFAITQNQKDFFAKEVYKKAYITLNFLIQFVQLENGKVSNYGNNDGALFFPLSDYDFQDYRPALNSLHLLLTGQYIFNEREDFIALNSNNNPIFDPIQMQFGAVSFAKSGYFIFREKQHFTFIRCASYKDRPAQADNLHIDIWINGENVLFDGGTYKYNTDVATANYFFGTQSHNTVMIGDENQMLKGGRFIWYYWTKALQTKTHESSDFYSFEGKISAFRFLNKNITHQRKVFIYKNENKWEIEDRVENNPLTAKQLWNFTENSNLIILANSTDKELVSIAKESFQSNYYGVKSMQKGVCFAFQNHIITKVMSKMKE
jgi:hypothetical protein